MEILKSIFYMILGMSLIASIIGLITLIIKNILKSKISPRWLNILWIVFLVALINPIRFQSNFSIYNILNYETIMPGGEKSIIKEALDEHTNTGYLDLEAQNDIEKNATYIDKNNFDGINNSILGIFQVIILKFENMQNNFMKILLNNADKILKIIIVSYFSIVFAKIIISLLTNLKVDNQIKTKFENRRLENILKKVKHNFNINKNITLIKQDIVATPAIYGVIKPKILLREDILNMTDEEIELILLHELSHMKKGDILLNKLLQFLKIIYWFNPLVLVLINKIKRDIELSNDEMVIENMKEEKINTYCKTLLKVSLISNNEYVMALGIVSKAKDLEERIRMIKKKKDFFKNKMLIISTILVLVLGITVCFATSKLTSEKGELANVNQAIDSIISDEIEKNISLLVEKAKNTGLKNAIYPIEGDFVLTAAYGKRMHPVVKEYIEHTGVDIARSGISGDKVMTVANGIVEYADFDMENGNAIEIKHVDDETGKVLYTYYAHLSEIEVKVGDYVEQGDKIGKVGSTGKSTGPHLHFEIRDAEKNHINPSEYLKF